MLKLARSRILHRSSTTSPFSSSERGEAPWIRVKFGSDTIASWGMLMFDISYHIMSRPRSPKVLWTYLAWVENCCIILC